MGDGFLDEAVRGIADDAAAEREITVRWSADKLPGGSGSGGPPPRARPQDD